MCVWNTNVWCVNLVSFLQVPYSAVCEMNFYHYHWSHFVVIISASSWMWGCTSQFPHSEVSKLVFPYLVQSYLPYSNVFYVYKVLFVSLLQLKLFLTARSTVLHEKLTFTNLFKKWPVIYWTSRFITVFTRACYWSLFWPSCCSPFSHPVCLRSSLILSYHQHLCFSGSLFCSGFLTKILHEFIIPMDTTCPRPSHIA
jgi:hypothetical protein